MIFVVTNCNVSSAEHRNVNVVMGLIPVEAKHVFRLHPFTSDSANPKIGKFSKIAN